VSVPSLSPRRAGASPTSPRIGLGTAPPHGGTARDLEAAIGAAIDCGCTLFDTAEVYGSEPVLGRLLRERSVERDAIELVTKLWQTNHAPEHVLAACQGSLRRLGVERLDLYLVHAPESWRWIGPLEIGPDEPRAAIEARVVPIESGGVALADTWEAMLDLVRRGLARQVGLANVEVSHLAALEWGGLELPGAVQIEIHPLRPRRELRRWCAERGIRVLAHTPLAGAALVAHDVVVRAAREIGTSPASLVLRWHLDRGLDPLPGSHRPEHVRANLSPLDAALPAPIAVLLDGLAPRR